MTVRSALFIPLVLAGSFLYGAAPLPKNTILFIGDGMGTEQIKAAGYALYGASNTLAFEQFPHRSFMTTDADGGKVTDSAASATAMATGVKVNIGVLSQRIPGDGRNLSTVLESYQSKGKRTGLVTTADITDATPAAFAAHQASRRSRLQIANDYFMRSRPNVLFGSAKYITPLQAKAALYTVLLNWTDLLKADLNSLRYVSGQFSTEECLEWSRRREKLAPDQPSLTVMTESALAALGNHPEGFFLLVENELIDNAGHGEIPAGEDRTKLLIDEVDALDHAVLAAKNWAASHPDTLIVVTADHECGDLTVTDPQGEKGVLPHVEWGSTHHTGKPVALFAWGNGLAEKVAATAVNVRDNTDLSAFLQGRLKKVRSSTSDH